MLNASPSIGTLSSAFAHACLERPLNIPSLHFKGLATKTQAAALQAAFDDETPVEWSEEDVVLLHWRLLKEVGDLRDPATPLEEKLDTLRWVFTDRDKESQPFSFVNCLKVVGCSPLSPLPYVGLVDAEEMRDAIQLQVKAWLNATLERYPSWVREAVLKNPEWVESRLAKNPQWINEQIRKQSAQGDLFA